MMPLKSISTFISRSIVFSLLLLMAAPVAQAQSSRSKAEWEKMRQKQIYDSIPLFRGVQVMVDLIGPIQRAVSAYGQYEAGVRVNLKDKYFPVVEVGYGEADHTDDVTQNSYKTSAPYGKLGVDFNIMKNKHDDNRVYAGLRYACTYFKCDIDHAPITDPVWGGETPFSAHGVKANYHWMEVLAGVDAKIAGPLRLGWTVRYRRRVHYDNGLMDNVWYVPGYGKQGSSRISGTFNIIYEF